MFTKIFVFLLFFNISTTLLAQELDLEDVILGEKPSLFPLPLGWVIILIGITLFIVLASWFIKRWFFPSAYIYTKREINALKKQNLPPVQTAKELSKILKRVAILKFGQEATAALTHQEWKKFLQEKSFDQKRTKEINLISKATFLPPEKDVAITNENLYTYAEKWVKTVLKGK